MGASFTRRLNRGIAAAAFLTCSVPVFAQGVPTVRVVSPRAIVSSSHPTRPGDPLITVTADTVFEVIDRDGEWYWILIPSTDSPTMRSGWIRARDVEVILEPKPTPAAPQRFSLRRDPERDPFYARLVSGARDAQLFQADSQNVPVRHRGFIEGRGVRFPQAATNDQSRAIEDVLFREEVFLKPTPWFRFAAGFDLRANTHDEVEYGGGVDFSDRTVRRPAVAIRRLTATVMAKHFTVDLGKQFIRWGRADILNPTDRFAPRDYLNVIDSDLLPVLGARPAAQIGRETFEAVWVPRLTPSRLPLVTQRWTVVPPDAGAILIKDGGSVIPPGSEWGARWNHSGDRFESSLSYFDGFNHLPRIDVKASPSLLAVELTRVYPDLRMYGGDLAVPTRLITLKGEAAYFTSSSSATDQYVLYVVEVERQTGEWLLDAGYAGEVVTSSSAAVPFAPDRGTARSFIGRASYTVDPRRTVAIEAAVRESGEGVYVKGEYSEAWGQHWRLTMTGVGIGGHQDDFLGQYNRNSHGSIGLRFSF
jgi:hypothetical protein